MEGYLQLWQGFFSRWTRYYFRIHDELLLFGPSKQQVEGRVHLRVAQIISKLDDPLSLLLNTGTEMLYLRAYSLDEKVKWYKRLKEAQRQNEELTQNRELFKMKVELSRVNRFKILDDLNTELWRCHAQLQQRLQEVIVKTRNIMVGKNIDRLRISIDEFKYKTAQMLQYIDQEIRDSKEKGEHNKSGARSRSNRTQANDKSNRQNSNGNRQGNNDTRFYSFTEEPKAGKTKNRLSLQSLGQIPEEEQSFSSLALRLKMKKSTQQTPLKLKRQGESSYSLPDSEPLNSIKYKLFHENKVYLKIGRVFPSNQTRRSLPEKFTLEQKFPVLGTVSSALTAGTDLSKTTMPITTNEPISTLQQSCEQMYYCELLRKADQENDENRRMLYVAAFAVSVYSLADRRTKKPFNPLLGQTFEFIDENRGLQFLAEQVSHHPPISTCCVRSDNYELYDNSKSTINFAGNSIKVTPSAKTVVKLERYSDYYIYNKCIVALTNILLGKTTVEVYGEVRIHCKDYNTETILQFKQDSMWKSGQAGKVTGHLTNQGKKLYTLEGFWNKELTATNIETKEKIILWQRSHIVNQDYYNFNEMTLQLNHLTARNSKHIPPTDSRLRPDQRALEYRLMDLATEEKNRLEEKQRNRGLQMQKSKQQHKILWFKQTVIQGEEIYISNERYWDEKIKGTWRDCLDIYN